MKISDVLSNVREVVEVDSGVSEFMAIAALSFLTGRKHEMDLSKYCAFDSDNKALFVAMLNLRNNYDWDDREFMETAEFLRSWLAARSK